jgi:hypothetical protein
MKGLTMRKFTVGLVTTAAALGLTLAAGTPAMADNWPNSCHLNKYCGGAVFNNYAGNWTIISNCWPDEAPEFTVYRRFSLTCQDNGYSADRLRARWYLPEGRWSRDNYHYRDTDAIGFSPGCDTRYHFYGERTNARTFYNRGHSERAWMKIGDWQPAVYIDGVSC